MKEVVVYTEKDYSKNKSIFVNSNLNKKQIINVVNTKFPTWHYFDIL